MSARAARPNVYISVDIEADGPIPGPYSMISFGAAVAGRQSGHSYTAADPEQDTFYRELRPISEAFVPEALAVSGLDRDRLLSEGAEPAAAMAEFRAWVREVSAGAQPVMCGYPASFDWTFLYWYLMSFGGESPFGHSGCLDMKTLYATKAQVPLRSAVKRHMPPHLLSRRPHTHHALDDAIEQAELMSSLMLWEPPARSPLVTHVSWGRMEVEGLPPGKDFVLYPGGGRAWDWSRHGTRHEPGIQPADVRELLDRGCAEVVLSRGMELRLHTMPETLSLLQDAGVGVHVEETTAAVALYNRLAATERVGGLFHSTC
ncbi:MTH938/NDUFAF3 family protein [Streptomyces sp. NBC_00503]|uniref:MTH938/NDUFAF3 family protein n=1 Tax=Streptomyces sp. NBC_00503 TaxID=2903659 RepID=UPI002E823EE0|nr:MTH938/NDUFAF3 family protein [Streptomyces sp. NBC_00503]WUD84406.1 MTH938/NDUFAF3 family protein [Streptomyces sp. NBC_00503]